LKFVSDFELRISDFRMEGPCEPDEERPINMTTEHTRLEESRTKQVPWKKWGPYLSERQWGTVREDYSENGDAWNFFTHDQAR
jgi:hypothetical protein